MDRFISLELEPYHCAPALPGRCRSRREGTGLDISWNEDAVAAVRLRDGDKAGSDLEVVAQGPLSRVLDAIAAGFATDIGRMRISFPERHKPPFRYEGAEIAALLAERGRTVILHSSAETSTRPARSPSPRG